jgi:hypothetical protein
MIFDLLWPEGTKSKITSEVAGQGEGLPVMILDLLAPQSYKSNITFDQGRSVTIGAKEWRAVSSRQ